RYIIFWSFPAMALALVLRAHATRAILGSGKFDWTDTRLTAAVFGIFILSLVAQGITLLLIRAYYAAGETRIPVFASAVTAVVTLAVALLGVEFRSIASIENFLEALLRVTNVPGTEVLILPIAWTLGTCAGMSVLFVHFSLKHGAYFKRVLPTFLQAVCASVFAGLSSYVCLMSIGDLEAGSTFVTVVLKGFVAAAAGVIVASVVYWVLCNREIREVAESMEGRILPRGFAAKFAVPYATSAEESSQTTL
ncbi:MAG: lipid II flippase MurJ, partial [Candidatus Nitrotoga sp.]